MFTAKNRIIASKNVVLILDSIYGDLEVTGRIKNKDPLSKMIEICLLGETYSI